MARCITGCSILLFFLRTLRSFLHPKIVIARYTYVVKLDKFLYITSLSHVVVNHLDIHTLPQVPVEQKRVLS